MKNDLTCGVVRDLLPSYVENLLGEEAKEAVDRHLETCSACTAQKEAMAARTGPESEESAKEVDFLKRVKKGTVHKIVLAVVCTVLLVVGGYLLKEFVIGRTPDAEHISIENPQVDAENNLNLLADTYWGAYELRGLKSTEENGILTYTAREVRVNPFQTAQGGYRKQIPLSTPLDGLTEVWICGRLVWQDGMVIDRDTLLLLDAKTPYCGDAPALGNIAKLLQVGSRIGRYNISLQTSERPYRWTLEFETAEETTSATWGMSRFLGYQMLALVENLDEVSFRYPSSSGVFTAELASAALARVTEEYNAEHGTSWPVHESIKEYAESPLEYQRLVTLLEQMFLGTSGTTVTVVKP